jgi:hypothetical protein
LKLKINGTPASKALEALTPHAGGLYASLGKRIVVIAELAATERTQVASEEDKDTSVTVQIKHCEVAGPEQEDAVRQAMRALFTHRTAYGKLDEANEVELSERTIELLAGEMTAIEAARLHVGIDQWGSYAANASRSSKLTASDLRRELTTVADALHALVYPSARKTEAEA